jgi:hypothetical protein
MTGTRLGQVPGGREQRNDDRGSALSVVRG